MAGSDLLHFEPDRFEALAADNGFRYWLASDLMATLNYQSMPPIRRAVQRAISASVNLNVPIGENFAEVTTDGIGRDWSLSRFACYLTVMNCDPKNPLVAKSQGYFVQIAQSIQRYVQEPSRLSVSSSVARLPNAKRPFTAPQKTMACKTMPYFKMRVTVVYTMFNLSRLKQLKGLPSGRTPLDYMGKTESAANLFRITKTEEKIKNEEIYGQSRLERAAEAVGKKVRSTMIEISVTKPEDLPSDHDIKQVRSGLKRIGKGFAKLDKPRRPSA